MDFEVSLDIEHDTYVNIGFDFSLVLEHCNNFNICLEVKLEQNLNQLRLTRKDQHRLSGNCSHLTH